jgi:hypothetical protein
MPSQRSHTMATACLIGALLGAAGCGSFRAAASFNSIHYVQEQAPLTVVVHRAQAAEQTAAEVDRLLNGTSVTPASAWLTETQLAPELIAEHKAMFADHPHYEGTKYEVLPAAIWAHTLRHIAENEPAGPSLVSAISADLGARYAAIGTQIAALAQLEADIEIADESADQDSISDDEKKLRLQKRDQLKAQLEADEQKVAPLRQAFLGACRSAAKQLPAAEQARLGTALVNLRQAADHASAANTAAVAGYPMALRGSKEALIAAAKASASDYVFERTGKRVKMKRFEFQVGADSDGKISLQINGLSPSDVGELSIAEIVTETLARTQRFLTSSLKLLRMTADTQERVEFQLAALDELLAGFGEAGYKAPVAALATPKSNMFGHLFDGLSGKKEKPTQAVARAASSGGEQAASATLAVHAEASVTTAPPAAAPADDAPILPAASAPAGTSESALVQASK